MRILVVEDDRRLSGILQRGLTEEGYQVVLCHTGADALARPRPDKDELIILDWMLPDGDGLHVCRTLRAARVFNPIVMLTARGELQDKVSALESGADDYVVKPFEFEELLARVRAVSRRSAHVETKASIGPLEVDWLDRNMTVDGRPVDLTTREFAVLAYLAQRRGKLVSRNELLEQVWGRAFDPSTSLVEVHVRRLREKLGARASLLATSRGRGYRLSDGSDP